MLTCCLVGMTLAIGQVESGVAPASPAPINTPDAAVSIYSSPTALPPNSSQF
jgi:hypothetical protein